MGQLKISGRHKSVPRELKQSLAAALPQNTKVVMNDICSCRHNFSSGSLRVTETSGLTAKIRGYYGSGIANFFVKFGSQLDYDTAMRKLETKKD